MTDTLIEDIRTIRLSMTPGARMLLRQIPPPRKQLRVLREAEAEILRLRKIIEKTPQARLVVFR